MLFLFSEFVIGVWGPFFFFVRGCIIFVSLLWFGSLSQWLQSSKQLQGCGGLDHTTVTFKLCKTPSRLNPSPIPHSLRPIASTTRAKSACGASRISAISYFEAILHEVLQELQHDHEECQDGHEGESHEDGHELHHALLQEGSGWIFTKLCNGQQMLRIDMQCHLFTTGSSNKHLQTMFSG